MATLEPAILEAPPRIRIYDPLYEPDPTRPLKEHRGIPVLLLDYLVVSAILVCSDKLEWLQASSQTSGAPKAERETQNLIQQWRHHVESVAEEEDIQVPARVARSSSPAGSSTSIVDVSMDSVYGHGQRNDIHDTPRMHDRRSLDLSTPSTNPSTIFTSFSGVPHPYAAQYHLDGGSSPASEFGQSIYSAVNSDGRAEDTTPRHATHPINRNNSGHSAHGRMASMGARSEPDRPQYAASIISNGTSMSTPAGTASRRRPLPSIPTGAPAVPPVPNIPPELLARLNIGQRAAGVGMSEFGEPNSPMALLQTNSLGFSTSTSASSSPLYPHYSNSPSSEGPLSARSRVQTLSSSPDSMLSRNVGPGYLTTDADPRRRTTSESASMLVSSPRWPAEDAIEPNARDISTPTPHIVQGRADGDEGRDDEPVNGANVGGARLQHRMSMYKGPRPGDEEEAERAEPSVVHANAVDSGLLHGNMVQPLRIRDNTSRPRTSAASSSTSSGYGSYARPSTAGGATTLGGQSTRSGAVLEEDELEVDLDHNEIADGEFAPPSYDSIDFSRPPVKPHQTLRIPQQ